MNQSKKPAPAQLIVWACPKCAAEPNKHGRGECRERHGSCMGFICECEHETAKHHGETLSDVCKNANCFHCGWVGVFPQKSKGLLPWEKKAIDAGWTMPAARAKELGL